MAQHVVNNPRSYDIHAIVTLLLDAKRSRLLEKGQDPDSVPTKLSNSTVRNYFTVTRKRRSVVR